MLDRVALALLVAACSPTLPPSSAVPSAAAPTTMGVPDELPRVTAPSATTPASTPPLPAATPVASTVPAERSTSTPGPLVGVASYYAGQEGQAAAGPALREWLGPDWRGQTVKVCASRCLSIRLVDACQCFRGTDDERIIDLSREDFAKLRRPSAGLVRIVIWPWP